MMRLHTPWLALTAMVVLASSATAQSTKHFTVMSTDVRPHKRFAMAQVESKFGCSGDNISPALAWSEAPAGTRSFAVTIADLDAPGFWHWLIYNIPATVTALSAGAGDLTQHLAPTGSVQGANSFGDPGYGGPCPPPGGGPHRYRITVFALKVDTLTVPQASPPTQLGAAIRRQALAQADLLASYSR